MLSLLMLATTLSARPRVAFTASVNIPPYTERWRTAGLLGEVERRVVEAAEPRLRAFEFLEWQPGGEAGARMLLAIEEDANSRPAGARPWVLVIELSTREGTKMSQPIRVARASQAHDLSRDVVASASDFILLVQRALDELTVEETAKMFVANVLSGVPIADDIDTNDGKHALINVPYLDLHATAKTRLGANFQGAPQKRPPATLNLFLTPLAGIDTRTECSVTSPDAAFQKEEEWSMYVKGRRPPVWISVADYEPDRRSTLVRTRMGPQ
jgi:hypothetical protein